MLNIYRLFFPPYKMKSVSKIDFTSSSATLEIQTEQALGNKTGLRIEI